MARDHSSDQAGAFIRTREVLHQLWETIRRAFVEFLKIPTIVIVGFLLLAVVMFFVDEATTTGEKHDARAIWGGLFTDPQAARDFLGVIAGSIITVTSITLSLLLIAVQQGAAALTSLVFDQFLRRRANQLYFGFFIGLALYSLLVLASITPSHQPVYGVAAAGLMTAVALYMLVLLIYATIDQMRPVVIIKAIHDHALIARQCQLDLLRNTRRSPRLQGAVSAAVAADRSGFLTRIDTAAIATAVADDEAEIVVLVSIGAYVAFGDRVAEIRTARRCDVSSLEPAVRSAIMLEEQRDLDTDPAYGVEQLATIGWTSISTAKSNPSPGLLAIWNLRDLLARWLRTDSAFGATQEASVDTAAPVVYIDDLLQALIGSFDSLAVVASESMQHQSAAEIYRALASLFGDMPAAAQRQVNDLLLRSLSGLGDHVLTRELEAALSGLVDVLTKEAHSECAAAIAAARNQLGLSVGRLHSRSTRSEANS